MQIGIIGSKGVKPETGGNEIFKEEIELKAVQCKTESLIVLVFQGLARYLCIHSTPYYFLFTALQKNRVKHQWARQGQIESDIPVQR